MPEGLEEDSLVNWRLAVKTAVGRKRLLSIVVLIVAFSVAPLSGCGHESATSDEFAGWWFADSLQTLHILHQDSAYVLAADSPLQSSKPLHRDGDTLIIRLSKGQLELTPASDGKLDAKLTGTGAAEYRGRYARGTMSDQRARLAEDNMGPLVRAIVGWQRQHHAYPPVGAVRPDGLLARLVQPWPTNPYTGEDVMPGSEPGNYLYRFNDRGFTLRLAMPNGGSSTSRIPVPSSDSQE